MPLALEEADPLSTGEVNATALMKSVAGSMQVGCTASADGSGADDVERSVAGGVRSTRHRSLDYNPALAKKKAGPVNA